MEMIDVVSSNIKSVGYDNSKKDMIVKFHDGSIYAYHNIQEKLYIELLNASSKGHYLDANVKKAGYGYTKLN